MDNMEATVNAATEERWQKAEAKAQEAFLAEKRKLMHRIISETAVAAAVVLAWKDGEAGDVLTALILGLFSAAACFNLGRWVERYKREAGS